MTLPGRRSSARGPSGAFLWALAALVVAVACGRGGPGQRAAAPSDSMRPAPPPDRPLLPANAVRLTERFRLGDPGRLELPRDLAVDGQGFLYVLDFAGKTELLKYDSTGQFVLRFGEREADRNPIGSAAEFALAPWNEILLVDRGKNQLSTFLTLGTFASAVHIEPGVALNVLALPEFGEFYLHKWIPEQNRSTVLYMRAPYDSLATTYEVAIPSGIDVRRAARSVRFLTATDRRGRLYVAFQDGYPVRVLTPRGETVRLVDLAREPLGKSPERLSAERQERMALLKRQAPDISDSLLAEGAEPDSLLPIVEELVVDPQERLWVRTNRPDADQDTPYDVFNERGQYLARVVVPGKVQRTSFSPTGRLFAIVQPTGVERREIVGYDVGIDAAAAPADSTT